MIVTHSLIEAYEDNGNANGVRGTISTIANNASLIDTQFGQGYQYNGINQLINRGNLGDLSTELTISIRFKLLSYKAFGNIFTTDNNVLNNCIRFEIAHKPYFNGFYTEAGDNSIIYHNANDNKFVRVKLTTIFQLNVYYHVAFTMTKNGEIKGYTNGIQTGSGTFSKYPASISNLTTGCGFKTRYSNVIIDEIKLWSKALSDTDIKRIYEGFSPLNG